MMSSSSNISSRSSGEPPAANGAAASANSKTPRPIRHAIPPLSKSTATPLSIRRRLDMRLPHRSESDPHDPTVLSQRLNRLALERTPAKTRRDRAPSSSVAMPSPGLKKIRERLAAEKENSAGGDASTRQSAAKDGASTAKAAAAERSAAKAFESIFEQEEELLSAMSAALASSGMPTPSRDKSRTMVKVEDNERFDEAFGHGSEDGKTSSKMKQAMLCRVAKSIEDVTREQLTALSEGLAADGDGGVEDLKTTTVYWITMARFEECHDRIEAARTYLQEGIEYMSSRDGGGSTSMQTNALRLALDRFEKRVAAHGVTAEDAPAATAATCKVSKSPSRSPVSKKSPGKAKKNGIELTPTRRSERIRRKSLGEHSKEGD